MTETKHIPAWLVVHGTTPAGLRMSMEEASALLNALPDARILPGTFTPDYDPSVVQPVLWTEANLSCGVVVCPRPGPNGPDAASMAKHGRKLGYVSGTGELTLISLGDGCTTVFPSSYLVAEWLNRKDMVPMRRSWYRDMNAWMELTLGLVPD